MKDNMQAIDMFDELEQLLCKDIKTVIAKGDITPPDYQALDTAVDLYKDAETIKAMIMTDFGETEVNGMVSGRMMPTHSYGNSGMTPYYGNSWDDGYGGGNSYARGRSAMTGRYVSRDDEMSAKLNHMMQTAGSEQERQIISRMMNELGR